MNHSTQASDPRRKPQNAQRPYHLVESEFSFLKTGELPGSYQDRPDKLHSRIEDKVNRLPDRLQLLFEDVSLLDLPPLSEREVMSEVDDGVEGGYFTPDQWGNAWLELMEIHPDVDVADKFTYRSSHIHNPAGEFGRKLGELWASLMLYPQDIPPQRLWIDAIQGFIDGLYLDNPSYRSKDSPSVRRQFIETLVDEIEERAMKKIDFEANESQEWFEGWQERNRTRQQTRQEVEEILIDEGIDPLFVKNYIYAELTDYRLKSSSEADFVIDDEITRKRVIELVEEEQLRAKATILSKLSDDAKAIGEKSGRGPEPTDILETIYQNDGASSLEIAKECTKGEHRAAVTETAADLAGQKDPDKRPGKVWNELPILEGDSESWELTDYGRLLAEHMFDGHMGVGVWGITDDHIELLAPTLEY